MSLKLADIPVDQRIRVFCQLCESVRYIHPEFFQDKDTTLERARAEAMCYGCGTTNQKRRGAIVVEVIAA